jgi:AcrR family transcriptional regulator
MKKTDTKKRLLEATLKLISEKGYMGATTREIAQQAGVTELTLFRHFGSKEKLFKELLGSYTFLPRLKELIPELDGLSSREALELIATHFLLTLKERKAMVKIMYSEYTTYPENIREVYNKFILEMRTTMAAYFEGLQQQGMLRKNISPAMTAKMFLWILFSYFRSEEIMQSTGMKKAAMEKQVREMIDIFMSGTVNNNT